jgi:hypothetical protein
MIPVKTARLITMQIHSRFEEARAWWFLLLMLVISDSVTWYSFRQEMGKQ